jgi:threonine dehydratase
MAAPASATPLTMERVRAAQSLLRQVVPESRLAGTDKLSSQGGWVYLKLESEGPAGSFKVRGAYHAIDARQKQTNGKLPGVVTSSTGNHGAAVAYAASQLHIPSRVYLPENPNPAKRARIVDFGAEIVEVDKFLEETRRHAAKFAEESGWYNIVDGSDPDMLPGTATIACEILDKLTRVDVIFVPVGDSTPAYALSVAKGRAVSTDSSDTIADGLAVRETSEENVREMASLVDEFVLVSEEEMLQAMRHLMIEEHVIAEPAGAATTAAFLKNQAQYVNKMAVLVVTGSNVTEQLLLRALQSR